MKRIILTVTCILCGFSILLTAFLIHFTAFGDFSKKLRRETAAELDYIRAAIELSGLAYLEHAPAGQKRLTLIAPDGTLLFDSEGGDGGAERYRDQKEIREALLQGSGADTRLSESLGKQTYYYAVRLENGAILRIASGTESIFSSGLSAAPFTLLVVCVVFCAALFAASHATRVIVEPVNRLDLEKPEENTIYEELGPLLFKIWEQKDIIAAKREELRKKQREFETITSQMREGLLVLDGEGRILFSNQSALRLLGAESRETASRNILTLRRDEPFRRAVSQALGGGSASALLSSRRGHIRLTANPFFAEGAGIARADADKRARGAILVLLDVTEQEDREKLRREFSANVSHELKTPLTVISGYAELLSRRMVPAEDAPRFGAKIYVETRRLIRLINDIIQLSRLDEGAAHLKRESARLKERAAECARRLEAPARLRNISIQIEGEEAELSGFPRILEAMIFNLLDNAVKYNKDGGAVTLSLWREAGDILLSVADTGRGIPPLEQERVFERFYRIDKSRAGKASGANGTGLGLSIVKHGALLHDAAITVQSDGHNGSVITLRFPANGSTAT